MQTARTRIATSKSSATLGATQAESISAKSLTESTLRQWSKSRRPFHFSTRGPLAQLVEQETLNLLVVGSIPTRPTILSASLPTTRCLSLCHRAEDKLSLGSTVSCRCDRLSRFLQYPFRRFDRQWSNAPRRKLARCAHDPWPCLMVVIADQAATRLEYLPVFFRVPQYFFVFVRGIDVRHRSRDFQLLQDPCCADRGLRHRDDVVLNTGLTDIGQERLKDVRHPLGASK
jgi:hypothetical protein